jgi:hypothetical protein
MPRGQLYKKVVKVNYIQCGYVVYLSVNYYLKGHDQSHAMQCVRLFTFLLRCGPEAAIFVASKMAATIEESN